MLNHGSWVLSRNRLSTDRWLAIRHLCNEFIHLFIFNYKQFSTCVINKREAVLFKKTLVSRLNVWLFINILLITCVFSNKVSSRFIPHILYVELFYVCKFLANYFLLTGYGDLKSPLCYNCPHLTPIGSCHDITYCRQGEVNINNQ